MAQQRFYGTVMGRGDTEVGRVGTRDSGLRTVAHSSNGDVAVHMVQGNADPKNKDDKVSVYVREHGGSTKFDLYFGDVATLLKDGRVEVMRYLWDAATPAERKAFWKIMADKHLKQEFE